MVTKEALADSGFEVTEENADDTGIIFGTAVGGIGTLLQQQAVHDEPQFLARLPGGRPARRFPERGHLDHRDARLALARTGDALRATAHPIEIARVKGRGRTWALSADVQAYALGLTISFLALVLAAGSLAAERDENVVGRLARGLVTLGELVWAKVLLAALVALALGLGVSLVFGAIIQIGNVTGGEPWGRVPLLALGLLLAGAALGALGALIGAVSHEARTASLVALLVVEPPQRHLCERAVQILCVEARPVANGGRAGRSERRLWHRLSAVRQ